MSEYVSQCQSVSQSMRLLMGRGSVLRVKVAGPAFAFPPPANRSHYVCHLASQPARQSTITK
eukprot:scaffold583508_cov19-Prasinocladus_malaysianus.AAC.1